MKSKNYPTIFIALFLSFSTFCFAGEKSITVIPDHALSDNDSLFFFGLTFLSVNEGTVPDGFAQEHKVKLPASSGKSGFVQSPCFNSMIFLMNGYGASPIYFTNIGKSEMCAYVDVNHDYNYTNDKVVYKVNANGEINLVLHTTYANQCTIKCTFSLLSNFPKLMDYTERFHDEFEKNRPKEKLLDTDYWFKITAEFIKAQNILIGSDSMCVALVDNNLDGCYSSTDDFIQLLPCNTSGCNSRIGYGGIPIKNGAIIGFSGKAFEVITDNAKDGTIKIKPRPDLAVPDVMIIGKPLPHFEVTQLNGEKADIYSLMKPGKATYINFRDDQYYLGENKEADSTLYATKSDSVKIISLVISNNIVASKKFISDNNINWQQCFVDEKTKDLLDQREQYPFGILIDKNGNVFAVDVFGTEVMDNIRISELKH